MLVRVLIFTRRTNPSRTQTASTTLPIGHEFRGSLSSTISVTSPTSKFRLGVNHFWRSWSRGRYSRSQRFQDNSAIYWTCRQRRRAYKSSLQNTPGGRFGCILSSRKWLGVRASTSHGSSYNFIIGRMLIIDSISHRNVCRQSSFRICSLRRTFAMFLTVLIWRSRTPP